VKLPHSRRGCGLLGHRPDCTPLNRGQAP
jgi:hypothetical protein